MVRKKCSSCERKIESKFSFCPHCGESLNTVRKGNDFGMLGKIDTPGIQNEIKLPFGMEKMMGSLIKQLEKQMGSMNFEDSSGMPKGIKIRIARSPQMGNMGQMIQEKPRIQENVSKISEKELKRRMILPKVNVESKVKRLSNTIIYEIETPGVKKKEDVVLTELATGLEIKAYSNDKCYVKFIPLKVEVIEYYVQKEKVFVDIKG
jgi:HSP20 family molecular chaperone IbpA